MARLKWIEPGVLNLDTIEDYIALKNTAAAKKAVREVFETISGL